MNKRELIYIAILTVLIAFMDITGIPSAFFVNIQIADIEPFYYANDKFSAYRSNIILVLKNIMS